MIILSFLDLVIYVCFYQRNFIQDEVLVATLKSFEHAMNLGQLFIKENE
jgi:hypothetical protein